MSYWQQKSNYKEDRDYNKKQEIKKYNPSTKKAENLELADYLNSFNEYNIAKGEKNKLINLGKLKAFRKEYEKNVNINNTTDNAPTKEEQIKKLEEYLNKLKEEKTQGE